MQTVNSLQIPLAGRSLVVLVALLATLGTSPANAQAVTVISNSSDARGCYSAAVSAAAKFSASRDALDTCTRALDYENLTRSDKARTLINRGIVQSALERYQEALADYNAASALMPQMPEAFISRGNLWYLAEKYQRAADEYTQAMQMDFSRMYVAFYNRGLVNEKLGNLPAAIADYEQALKLQPQFKLASDRLELLVKKPNQ